MAHCQKTNNMIQIVGMGPVEMPQARSSYTLYDSNPSFPQTGSSTAFSQSPLGYLNCGTIQVTVEFGAVPIDC
jgi:hypothetical protein